MQDLLFLAHRIPFPPDKGDKIRAWNIFRHLARTHRMHLWDSVVCAASAQAGAKVLLTEDMQDGRVLDGLRLINPFAVSNAEAIEKLLID